MNAFPDNNEFENEEGRDPESNRREQDQNFPGYPHYASSEDILHPSNGSRKVKADPDELQRGNPLNAAAGRLEEEKPLASLDQDSDNEDDDLRIVPGTEADVTKDDLLILGPREGDMDLGDDEILRGKTAATGLADEELDIPGTDLDDENEALGEEDEENNYYSLGGDRHENLEEDNQQEPETDE